MQKALIVNNKALTYFNNVEFRLSKPYVKNSERKSNQWITGECDIYDADTRTIRDIKHRGALPHIHCLPTMQTITNGKCAVI